jgi:tight adherence protein B
VNGLAVLGLPVLLALGLILILMGVSPTRRVVRRRRLAATIGEWLTQAGLRRTSPAQLVGSCALLALVVGLLVAALSGVAWIGCAFAGLAAWFPIAVVRARRSRRLRELAGVWPDAIDHLASGVRAGLSLPEAVAGLANRGPVPLRLPAERFAAEYHASGRFGVGLERLRDDLADPTADRVVACLRLTREVGGTELGRVLRTLSAFLRDEQRLRREVEARQAWVVVSARLAFAMPWVVLLLLATRPEAAHAYQRPAGALVIAVGAAAAVLGYRLMLTIGRLPAEARVLRGSGGPEVGG